MAALDRLGVERGRVPENVTCQVIEVNRENGNEAESVNLADELPGRGDAPVGRQ